MKISNRAIGFFLVSFLVSSLIKTDAANVTPPPGSPKFLTLPFNEQSITIGQGWYYDSGTDSLDCFHPNDISGGLRHCGIDYFNGEPGARTTFEVVAAAGGRAMRVDGSPTAGTFVIIEHEEEGGGQKFFTRYLHLASGSPDSLGIPQGPDESIRVNQGDPIGMAGKSGLGPNGVIHLHFDVLIGGSNPPNDDRVDPYDIAGGLLLAGIEPTKQYYPGHNKYNGCGSNSLWIECFEVFFTPSLEARNVTNELFDVVIFDPESNIDVSKIDDHSVDTNTGMLRQSVVFLGNFGVRYFTPGYLQRKMTGVSIPSNTPISLPQLLAGDLNDDNIINTLDWSIMNSKWFTSDPIADINRDGLVNSIDYGLMNKNWGKMGD